MACQRSKRSCRSCEYKTVERPLSRVVSEGEQIPDARIARAGRAKTGRAKSGRAKSGCAMAGMPAIGKVGAAYPGRTRCVTRSRCRAESWSNLRGKTRSGISAKPTHSKRRNCAGEEIVSTSKSDQHVPSGGARSVRKGATSTGCSVNEINGKDYRLSPSRHASAWKDLRRYSASRLQFGVTIARSVLVTR